MSREDPELSAEDAADALLEGDRTFAPGSVRSAIRHRVFRSVYVGSLLSNIGSWMQNVVVAAYAYDQTGKASVVSVFAFAQLGPLLLLSLVGGALADVVDRKTLLIVVSVQQAGFSVLLAVLTRGDSPSLAGMVGCVLAVGIGQAMFSPTYSALLPGLVPRRDLAGAIALNSANMNLSRVIGPAIGGVLYAKVGAPAVFLGNAGTYGFIIIALMRVELPPFARDPSEPSGWSRMMEGFSVARRDRVVGRCLVTMTTFSFFSLPFAVQMPVLAAVNFAIPVRSTAYGVLYASFGLGAVIGALSIGTFLVGRELAVLVRIGLGGFAVSLATFALLRNPAPAYPMALIVGFFYFMTVTSLATALQQRLDDRVRGRVMALWVMAFGGTVPIGALVAGPIIDATSVTAVLIGGAVVAAILVIYADLRTDPAVEISAT